MTGKGGTAPFTGGWRGGGSVVVLEPSVHLIVAKLMVLIVTSMVVVLICKLPAVLCRNVVYGLAIRANILNFSYCLGGGGHLEQSGSIIYKTVVC